MRKILLLLVGVFSSNCSGKPSNLKTSIDQVLKTLREEAELSSPRLVGESERLRPKIITKYDFLRRDRSSELRIPPPMVVSTGLTVKEQRNPKSQFNEENQPKDRRGRNINFRAPRAQVSFRGLEKAVAKAPVIDGVRLPDDESDLIVHRNGRFINNVFVPDEVELPEFIVSSEISNPEELSRNGRSDLSTDSRYQNEADFEGRKLDREGRKLPFHFNFENFYEGRTQDMYDAMALESQTNEVFVKPDPESTSLYYLEETPDSLHSDRSPYTFEPADTNPRISQPQPAILQATSSDFEIKQHVYQMCPGCPTFQIPIPVPKSSLYSDDVINPYNQVSSVSQDFKQEENLIDVITNKIISTISPVINTARSWLEPGLESNSVSQTAFSDRLSSLPPQSGDLSPIMFASVAAVGLGVATLLSSGVQMLSNGSGRQFSKDGGNRREEDDLINEITADYDPSNVLCLPRHYCEKMKSKKHVLDDYENTKKIGRWILERIFDKDTVYAKDEAPIYNQCYLRECIFSLLS